MAMKGLNYPTKDELSYATSERDTGSTWIDGKAIYKKTISIGALPNASEKGVNHNISNVESFVNMEGFASDGDRTLFFNSPNTDTAGSYIRVSADATKVHVMTGLDRSSFNGYVTLYYTKVESND